MPNKEGGSFPPASKPPAFPLPPSPGGRPPKPPRFFCLALLFLAAVVQAQAPRFALVIGNAAYRHVDNLPNAVNDASDIAEKLAALGYQVDLLLDGDLAAMTRSAGAWIRRLSAEPAGEGFFWYAGHGVQAAGENYLLPVDIDAEDEAALIYGSYPLGRLLLSLEQTARNKLNLVVLDACRDNPFKNLAGSDRGLSRGFVTVEHPPQDIFIMFSTAPGTVAADGEGTRNSPFTEAFLRYIDSGEILPVMAGLITRETMRLTGGKQRPYQNGSIVSELYYSLAPSQSAAPPPSPVLRAPPERPRAPDMVLVPAGSFTMGSPPGEADRVGYQEESRRITLSPFYLGKRELSIAEFRRFIEETGYRTSAEQAGGAYAYDESGGQWEFRAGADWRRPGFRQNDDHPVVNVSWFDALRYCNWLSEKEGLRPAYAITGEEFHWDPKAGGYRLPTEAEWEYACRAGTAGPFSTGERISTAQANYNGAIPYSNDNRGLFRKTTTPAASLSPNPWGLYDMHGNVWEWCWDYYGLSGEDEEGAVNPPGPASGAHRVNRGGGWDSPAGELRSAARSSDFPETAGGSLGFRLARNGP
ncbi:MAG: SUMF1/EgtB/PvdO family nonheme iron enzyme [Treponema sp.]|jgi:formylglycine-generating enzyme required for sulfatase activity|nr:SUMF1/EgtB/PvdO family nonheme iron enzyme [Treponema sp.]